MSTQEVPFQIHNLTEGSFLVCSPGGNILLGCPPEILKRILAAHLPMPDTVVVPEKLYNFHSSRASLEFPLYHFLFVQRGLERGRKFRVVGSKTQCASLEHLLRQTVVGPSAEEMINAGQEKGLAKEIAQETTHLALKNPKSGKPLKIREMINFVPLEIGKRFELYPVREKHAAIQLERTGPGTFRVLHGEEAHDLDLAVSKEPSPVYKLRQKPMKKGKGQFTVTVLGRSNGFDPNDPANGYLINIDGKLVLWDCPAYLHQHLKKLRVDPKEIDALALSHVHEDHLDTSESLRDPPFEIYTTPEIYFSLLVKLSSIFDCSLKEATRFHKWHRVDVGKPMEICGAQFDFFHSVHAIPALGCRISASINGKSGLLHISGDHLSVETLKNMLADGGISKRRHQQVVDLLRGDETLILMDVGGGAIHGDYRDFLDYDGRVAFMHTGLIQDKLPKGKHLIESGEVLNVLE